MTEIRYLSSGSLIGDDPAEDKYEGWYDGTGEVLLLGDDDGDLEYKGDIPKVALEDPEAPGDIQLEPGMLDLNLWNSSTAFWTSL